MTRKLLHDEHLELNSNRLHIISEMSNDFEVWLNTEIADFDGLCIGCGPTREKAVYDAAILLERASRALRTTPAPMEDAGVAQSVGG